MYQPHHDHHQQADHNNDPFKAKATFKPRKQTQFKKIGEDPTLGYRLTKPLNSSRHKSPMELTREKEFKGLISKTQQELEAMMLKELLGVNNVM
jgi:hypothetical protein